MSSSSVEKIKEKLDIAEVVGSYIKLEKAGSNLKARCPFHNEKTPSFFISPNRGTYYCFGCGAKGDIFTFVQEFEGVDFRGALKTLALRAGVPLEPENPKLKNEKDRLYGAIEHATFFFEKKLKENDEALKYLLKRGLKKETIKEWRIGFVPNDWRQLQAFLLDKGFSNEELLKVGLIKKSEKSISGQEYYDTFRGRIIFPIFDVSGKPIAFSGRILVDDGKSSKYLNSPETILFSKSEVLYGLHKAKIEIRRKDYVVLVEGQMDIVMSHQAGVNNVVASSGTALTSLHLERLKKLSNRIIFAFDSDDAGFKAASRASELALSLGMEVKMVEIEGGKDPADLILDNPENWKKAVKNSVHIVDFYMTKLLSSITDRRKLVKEMQIKVLPYIKTLESNVEKGHFVSKIAKETGIKEDAIWEDLKNTLRINLVAESSLPSKNKSSNEFVKKTAGGDIAGIILWQETIPSPFIDTVAMKAKCEALIGTENFEKLINVSPDIKNAMIFEAEKRYGDPEILNKAIGELLINLEIDALGQKNEEDFYNLDEAKKGKNRELEKEILQRLQDRAIKINNLKINVKKSQ